MNAKTSTFPTLPVTDAEGPKKKTKKKARSRKETPTMSRWVPILRVPAFDFDEASGKFLDSMHTVELQQEAHSKRIRAIVVPD